MQKIANEVHGEGYLYEHKLEKRYSEKNKTDYISGKITVATNEDCTNTVDFHFIYVTPVYSKSGKPNPNYKLLENIVNSGSEKTVMGGGKENALKVKVDGQIGVNDFVGADKEIVTTVRNEVSFINMVTNFTADESKRSYFKTDMLITSAFRKEADEEKNVQEHLIIKGATFNDFTKALLPVSYSVYNPDAMNYFEKLEPSSATPVFTRVWGQICSQEFISTVETESAFGENLIEERKTTRKEYVVTGASSDCHEWDSEETILASEVKAAMSNRELHLAEVRKNYEEYQASKSAPSATPAANVAAGGFAF